MAHPFARWVRARVARRARDVAGRMGVRSVRRVINGVAFTFPLEASNLRHLLPWERAEAYEAEYAQAVLDRVRPGDRVLDIGAHLGLFTLLFADRVGPAGRVVACEPNPRSRALLEATLRLNDLPQADVVPVAVTDAVGAVTFSLAADESALASGDGAPGPGDDAERIEVAATTVDALAEERDLRPDVLKVDVEGFEPRVLDGAERTLPGVRMICMEVHPRKMAQGTGVGVDALLARLAEAGFHETYRYEPPKHRRDPGRPFNVIVERRAARA